MTDSHQGQEQHPLLCDECSDDDTSTNFHRRFRYSISSGRARTHAIGAARIITNWPDDISSLIKYWWIVLGMFAFFVFLIYNSFLAVALLPEARNEFKKNESDYIRINKSDLNPSAPNVYMHVFVAKYEEFDSKDYTPHVQTIAKEYANFNYNFIVILNDSDTDIVNNEFSDEQKNEMALNLLWTNDKITNEKKQHYEKLSVQYVSLTEYMDNSPLQKYWRNVPHHFIGFLARCIAVWDKGGVAFNPIILTQNAPNLGRLYSILQNFKSKNKILRNNKIKVFKKPKKKFNNIRDIIIDLEQGDSMHEIFPDSLSEAENIPSVTVASIRAKRNVDLISLNQHYSSQLSETEKLDVVQQKNNSDNIKRKSNHTKKIIKPVNVTKINDIATTTLTQNSKNLNLTRDDLKYLTKSVPEITKTKMKTTISSNLESSKLIIIDLKGNIIATETACHALIGTVFSNVFQYTDDKSVTDFIVSELSLFCKGSLSTCKNVEVILF